MRIKSIHIKDYRQYKKLEIDFTKFAEHDLHILIGQNGTGKTNLLNAINWCLYGTEPHLGDESRSLPKVNLEALKEAELSNKSKVSADVKILAENNGSIINFVRRQNMNVETKFQMKDNFTVTVLDKDGESNTYDDEDASRIVDRYMPQKIREYIFFDGEQLNNYFLKNDDQRVKDAVHTLSDINTLKSVSSNLSKTINDYRKAAGKKTPKLKELEDNITQAENDIISIKKTIAEINQSITTSEEIIASNSEFLRGQEHVPELEENYQNYMKELDDLDVEKNELENEMKKFYIDYKIAFSMYPYVKDTLNIIKEKQESNQLPPQIDKSLLQQMLDKKTCLLCERPLDDEEIVKIESLLDRIKVSSFTSNLLNEIKNDLIREEDLVNNYEKNKKLLFGKVTKNNKSIDFYKTEIEKISEEIEKFSDTYKIKDLYQERERHTVLLKDNTEKLGAQKQQLERSIKIKTEAVEAYDKALEKEEDCKKIKAKLAFADRAKEIIESVKQEIIDEIKSEMEISTTDKFTNLVWKANTYSHIELDDNYKLDLRHIDNYSCLGSCSAAERALLALSFTLAIHEVSGFDSLLFIDTPVSRVSDVNRSNFADVLRSVSTNKQIIMTFTPDEYSSDISEKFDGYYSSYRKLQMIDEKYTELR